MEWISASRDWDIREVERKFGIGHFEVEPRSRSRMDTNAGRSDACEGFSMSLQPILSPRYTRENLLPRRKNRSEISSG